VYDAKVFAYNASNTALNAFTVHLAHLLQSTNIKVNSIHPGWVQTEMDGPNAFTNEKKGAEISIQYALIGDDVPTRQFLHFDE
jgi:NAD(P)-dependent dehydrogenase (short-subunit alcohol dehydrogenase family)